MDPMGGENLQHQGDNRESQRGHREVDWNDELGRCRHCPDVGADVDGVRDEQRRHHAVADRASISVLYDGNDALAGDEADRRARLLDRGHEGQREQDHPKLAVSKLGARLRVGSDAGWIVVRGPRDQAWA